jgi:hypothetical protein
MKYLKPDKLYCFSPPVMAATFIIEISLAIHTLWRYKLSGVTKIAVVILACLAIFQIAEFNVCESAWFLDSAGWARLGYVAITLLPPLGIHLVNRISQDKRRWPFVIAYILSGAFVAYFLLSTGGISTGACLGNYVIFEQGHNTSYLYGLYYYGLLLAAIVYALYRSNRSEKHIQASLRTLMIGYAMFMVPTTFVNLINPNSIAGIPSIMCGFAVLLAIALADRVLPYYHKQKPLSVVVRAYFSRK